MRTYIVYLASLTNGCTCYFTRNTKQPIKKTQTKAPSEHTHTQSKTSQLDAQLKRKQRQGRF